MPAPGPPRNHCLRARLCPDQGLCLTQRAVPEQSIARASSSTFDVCLAEERLPNPSPANPTLPVHCAVHLLDCWYT
jgi:hypothetical protein